MKKMLVLSMLISFSMICSCQKQDSTLEAQLAQRKVALDSREQALDEREKAVEERENAVAEREKAVATNSNIQSQRQVPDAAQVEADRQRRIQQLPPELRALVPDRSRLDAEGAGKNPTTDRQRPVQRQRSLEDAQKKQGIGGALASPAAEVPQADASSPSPSPTPQ
jgi:hypothetical protein